MGLKDPRKIRASELSYNQVVLLESVQLSGLVLVSSVKSKKKDMEYLIEKGYLRMDTIDYKGKDTKVLIITETGKQAIEGAKNA